MEQLIFILIFAAIAVANQLLKKSRQAEDTPPPDESRKIRRPPPAYRPPARSQESEEERMRKFMEALGVPQTSIPPRKIVRTVRTSQSPQVPPLPVRPQRAAGTTPALPVQPGKPVVRDPAADVQPVVIETVRPPEEPATAFPEAAVPVTAAPMEEVPVAIPASIGKEIANRNPARDFRALLLNRDSIRRAILLREILGPPPGLQPYR